MLVNNNYLNFNSANVQKDATCIRNNRERKIKKIMVRIELIMNMESMLFS